MLLFLHCAGQTSTSKPLVCLQNMQSTLHETSLATHIDEMPPVASDLTFETIYWSYCIHTFNVLKGTVWHVGKYAYLLSC